MPWITVQLPAGRTVQPEGAPVATPARETLRVRSRGVDAMQVPSTETLKDIR